MSRREVGQETVTYVSNI